MPINRFTQDLAGQAIELRASEDFELSHHRWSRPELDALALAYAARRPLLVRGEPGSGKSQLARAAAVLLEAPPPLVEVIHPRFEPRDLLYRYDTIRRLADANAGVPLTPENERKYVVDGKLWRAWEAAKSGPVVVLID
jgi:MoxR-like ATPase